MCIIEHHAPLAHILLVQEFSKLKRQAGNVPGIAADVASLLRERGQACFALAGQAALLAARACRFVAAVNVQLAHEHSSGITGKVSCVSAINVSGADCCDT